MRVATILSGCVLMLGMNLSVAHAQGGNACDYFTPAIAKEIFNVPLKQYPTPTVCRYQFDGTPNVDIASLTLKRDASSTLIDMTYQSSQVQGAVDVQGLGDKAWTVIYGTVAPFTIQLKVVKGSTIAMIIVMSAKDKQIAETQAENIAKAILPNL